MSLVTTEAYDAAALANAIAVNVLLGADLKAGLYINPITPNKLNVVADLTPPPYASYLSQLVVMGPPFRDPVNGIAAVAAGLIWQMTGTPTPCIIQGIYYTYGTGPVKLLGIEPFAVPISLNDLLDAFTTVFEYIQSSDNPGFSTIIR